MDFGAGGEGLYEEEHVIRGKLPYSSNSSSSSSSHHYPGLGLGLVPVPLSSGEAHLQRGWLGKQYQFQQDTSRRYDGAAASSLELMDVSPRTENEDTVEGIQREHMFDKVVTPSDVGKLNRLVIPKQHAEKYFPLDSSTNDKGLLLNFEDRSGKPWRFRYSYWNSSQSYVMTKGWSRFVKEKKLDAGDIVSFQRGVGDSGKDRLYIDWRRRPNVVETPSLPHHFPYHHSVPWSPFFLRPPPVAPQDDTNININFQLHRSSYNVVNPVYYVRSATAAPQVQQREPMVFESVPVVHGKAAAKRLRLFGVNMECPISEEVEECEILSSTSIPNVTMATSQYLSSSANAQPPLPFRLYNGTPLPTEFVSKGKQASMSLDLDI